MAEKCPECGKLEARIMQLEKMLWGWSRGLIRQKAFTEKEIRQMYGPYIESGDTTGLSPREARLLETFIDAQSAPPDLDTLAEKAWKTLVITGFIRPPHIDDHKEITALIKAALKEG